MTVSEERFPADVDLDAERLTDVSYDDVPTVEPDAELDPNWVRLRGGSVLPVAYMPPSMAGVRAGWIRLVASGLAALFVAATTAGVCLTYGPPTSWF